MSTKDEWEPIGTIWRKKPKPSSGWIFWLVIGVIALAVIF